MGVLTFGRVELDSCQFQAFSSAQCGQPLSLCFVELLLFTLPFLSVPPNLLPHLVCSSIFLPYLPYTLVFFKSSSIFLPLQKEEPLDDCPEPTDLKIKSSPPPLCDISARHNDDDQTEPVDLSLNKPRPSLPVATTTSTPANPTLQNISATIPAVLSAGSILASTQGVGGQQILHVIHTIPSVSMPSKMGQLQTIPVVVQSLPVVYTTVPTDGVATAAITVPLIGSDGRSEGSGEMAVRSDL